LERKFLGGIHYRLGPNKVGLVGIFQPFSDAIKLFRKGFLKLSFYNYLVNFFSVLYGIMLMIILVILYYFWGNIFSLRFRWLYLFCFMSLRVYFLLGSGWSSGSIYSLMGGYRASAQAVRYEIRMVFLFIRFILILGGLEMDLNNEFYLKFSGFILFLLPMVIRWILIMLSETNRSPFDLAEGESELVSGFNTEYSGGEFSLIFITEYGSIIFMVFLLSLIIGGNFIIKYLFILLGLMIFLWVRGSFPRVRYDHLIILSWKSLLLFVLFYYFYLLLVLLI